MDSLENQIPIQPSSCSKISNCHPSDAFFVGDSIVDIKTAQSANISSVAVLWGNGVKDDFQRQNADFIVNSPQDLLDIF